MPSRRKALSLLEILFTLGLLTVILVAFAAVYPSAYRLNRKSARANIAAKTSSAVAAEILALPFTKLRDTDTTPNLADFSDHALGPGLIRDFVYRQMRTSIPEGYTIRPQAIQVTLFPPKDPPSTDIRFAEVRVTCYWNDSNGGGTEKSITIVSGKAENRDVR